MKKFELFFVILEFKVSNKPNCKFTSPYLQFSVVKLQSNSNKQYRWCSAKTAYSKILCVGNAERCIYSVFLVIAVGIDTYEGRSISFLYQIVKFKIYSTSHFCIYLIYL